MFMVNVPPFMSKLPVTSTVLFWPTSSRHPASCEQSSPAPMPVPCKNTCPGDCCLHPRPHCREPIVSRRVPELMSLMSMLAAPAPALFLRSLVFLNRRSALAVICWEHWMSNTPALLITVELAAPSRAILLERQRVVPSFSSVQPSTIANGALGWPSKPGSPMLNSPLARVCMRPAPPLTRPPYHRYSPLTSKLPDPTTSVSCACQKRAGIATVIVPSAYNRPEPATPWPFPVFTVPWEIVAPSSTPIGPF